MLYAESTLRCKLKPVSSAVTIDPCSSQATQETCIGSKQGYIFQHAGQQMHAPNMPGAMAAELPSLQTTQEIWDGFKREFLQQWSNAVSGGKGGDLALDALYGPKAPAGSASLQVSIA